MTIRVIVSAAMGKSFRSIFLLFIFLLQFHIPMATAGPFGPGDGGGGGNEVGLDFTAMAKAALHDLRALDPPLTSQDHIQQMEEVLGKAKVIALSSTLQVPVDLIVQNSVAVNFPDTLVIEIDADRWDSIGDVRTKKSIAIHELESLLRLESTGIYKLSSDYLAVMGFSGSLETEMKKPAADLPSRTDPTPRFFSTDCQLSKLFMKTDSETLVPMNMFKETLGSRVKWLDGVKVYSLDVWEKTQMISRSTLRQGETPDIRINDVEFTVKSQAGSGFHSQAGRLFSSYQALGDGRYQVTGHKDGETENPTKEEYREDIQPDGTEIVTNSSGSRLPQADAHLAAGQLRVVSEQGVCVYKPGSPALLKSIPVSLRKAIDRFSQQHQLTTAAKKAMLGCLSGGNEASCAAEISLYQEMDLARDATWRSILN